MNLANENKSATKKYKKMRLSRALEAIPNSLKATEFPAQPFSIQAYAL